MIFSPDIQDRAEKIIRDYKKFGKKIAVAESCTGGLVAAALTSVAGSSAVFDRGFVTYSNDAKIDMLGVLPDILNVYGSVSDEVAESMAEGALTTSQADVALSITGIAGPDGGSLAKPVGLVFFGVATRTGARFHQKCMFSGAADSPLSSGLRSGAASSPLSPRDIIRLAATKTALTLLLAAVGDE